MTVEFVNRTLKDSNILSWFSCISQLKCKWTETLSRGRCKSKANWLLVELTCKQPRRICLSVDWVDRGRHAGFTTTKRLSLSWLCWRLLSCEVPNLSSKADYLVRSHNIVLYIHQLDIPKTEFIEPIGLYAWKLHVLNISNEWFESKNVKPNLSDISFAVGYYC